MPKLTDAFVRSAPTESNHWDTEIKGFALFCGKNRKTWYFQRDIAGKTQRTRLGVYPDLTAPKARKMATQLAAVHARNARPEPVIGAPTLEEAMKTYLRRPKLRSEQNRSNVRAQIEKHLGDWLDRPLDTITKRECRERHEQLGAKRGRDGRPIVVTANHVMKSFGTIYRHARKEYDLPECPTFAIEWFDERRPQAIIEDLPAWLAAVEAMRNPIHAAYYKTLLLTGLRKSEAATLRWEHIHKDHLHLPVTKNGRPFDLPILDEHHAILEPMKGLSAEWVFPAWRGETPHILAPTRIAGVNCHMHRRTFATMADKAGVLPEVVGRLLNHTPTSVTERHYVAVDYENLREPMTMTVGAFKQALPKMFG